MKQSLGNIGSWLRHAIGTLVFGGCLFAGVALGQDAQIDKQLESLTQTRDHLRGEVQNIGAKLEGAQQKLQDLMRRQAPYEDIQYQKEQIRVIQRENLKLMAALLQAEEQRTDVLMKARELKASKVADETREKGSPTSDGSTVTSKTPDPKNTGMETTPLPRPTFIGTKAFTLADYQQAIAEMKDKKTRLMADYNAYLTQRDDAEDKLAGLPDDAPETSRATLRKTINDTEDRANRTKEALDLLAVELSSLQDGFEKFVLEKNRDDFIMPGQKLEVIVAEDKSFNGEYTVRDRGYIILDRVGRVMVAGKTREDAELAVKKALEKTQLRIATVLLEAARMDDPKAQTEELQREYLKARIRSLTKERADIGQDVIYLYGAFNKPGPWPIPKNFKPTLLTTIIRAGGTTDGADLSTMRVLRSIDGEGMVETVDVKGLMAGTPGLLDVKLQPNDIIIAPASPAKKLQSIYLTGSVKKPGAFELSFDKPATAYTVLLRAGGVSRFANLSKVYILREEGEAGKKVKLPADLKQVKEGKLSDPELKPNDIIVVPESFWGAGN